MNHAKTTLCLALSALAAACGGPPPPPDLHAAFAEIQVQEAVIAHAAGEASECDAPDCPAAARVCEAAEAICEIARSIDDADAHARCDLARRRCPAEEAAR